MVIVRKLVYKINTTIGGNVLKKNDCGFFLCIIPTYYVNCIQIKRSI